ncbi:MAG: NAD-dependent epimerase/dehydratase family protein [Phycisphaerales bacterium]|nr:MAG: NAD-dependent epimerase/dehydratase family protein [Phycisphaerales bacterium]
MSDTFYEDKKVLVTGGTGFVGTHIVQELLKHGARVIVPIHNRPLASPDSDVEIVQADLTHPEDCLRATRGVDFVFHAAGVVTGAGVTALDSMSAITANLVLTSRILEAAWATDVDRVLIFSSSTGYPVADYPITEDEFWSGPTHQSYFGYGWMRRYLERLAEYVASKSQMKIAIVRPTAVYGRFDNFDPVRAHVIPALILKAIERVSPYEVWGTGDEVRDFLHVEDLARGCLMMLENYAECDPINIGYGEMVTVAEIVKMILDATSYVDAEVVFNSTRPTAIPFRMVDTSKAKELLGFEHEISLEEGLNDTVQWYKQHKVGISL